MGRWPTRITSAANGSRSLISCFTAGSISAIRSVSRSIAPTAKSLPGSPGWESALRQRRNQLALSNARDRTVRYARDCSAPAEKSDHHRRIRQLIAAGALLGKTQRQLLRYRFDACNYSALEIPPLELCFHFPADILPACGADLGIDTAIGDDLDVAIGQQQI